MVNDHRDSGGEQKLTLRGLVPSECSASAGCKLKTRTQEPMSLGEGCVGGFSGEEAGSEEEAVIGGTTEPLWLSFICKGELTPCLTGLLLLLV